MRVVRITVTKNKLYWCHGYLIVSTKCRLQAADQIQNVECRLQGGYKMQTENLKRFFVWYVITCHLTTYWASRNRFFVISVNDYLHYCGIFLVRFLIKIFLNTTSSLHTVFSLCVRDFTNLIKVDVDGCKWDVTIKYFTRAIFEKHWQLSTWSVVSSFKRYVFILLTKCGPRPKLFLRLDIFSALVDHIMLTYLRKSFIPNKRIK